MDLSNLQTVRVRFEGTACHLQLYRPEARNTINARMVAECRQVLQACEALKYLLGIGETLQGRLLHVDLLGMRFHETRMTDDSECMACGNFAADSP